MIHSFFEDSLEERDPVGNFYTKAGFGVVRPSTWPLVANQNVIEPKESLTWLDKCDSLKAITKKENIVLDIGQWNTQLFIKTRPRTAYKFSKEQLDAVIK